MRNIIIALTFTAGCASFGADGKPCRPGEAITRPDRCGTSYQRREWAAVGGVLGKPNLQCQAIASYLDIYTSGATHTGLMIPDERDPRRIHCVPWNLQIATPSSDSGGSRF